MSRAGVGYPRAPCPHEVYDPAGIREFRDMIRGFVAEGRTVLHSSHLRDEVEKICDEVAIVDRGRVVMQCSIAELAAGGEQTIFVATSDDERSWVSILTQWTTDAPARDHINAQVSTWIWLDAQASRLLRCWRGSGRDWDRTPLLNGVF
jgi:ABC-type multidrug transport system ATPase subunit